MKKLQLLAVTITTALLIAGCDKPNETLLIAGASTAGNLGLSAWFAIDNPDTQVKETLRRVIGMCEDCRDYGVSGDSFVDSLTPAVQDIIANNTRLTTQQKNLLNTGAIVLLSALDTYLMSNPDIKGNVELCTRVINSFCKGCLTALDRDMASDCATILNVANKAINMQYDDKARVFSIPKTK